MSASVKFPDQTALTVLNFCSAYPVSDKRTDLAKSLGQARALLSAYYFAIASGAFFRRSPEEERKEVEPGEHAEKIRSICRIPIGSLYPTYAVAEILFKLSVIRQRFMLCVPASGDVGEGPLLTRVVARLGRQLESIAHREPFYKLFVKPNEIPFRSTLEDAMNLVRKGTFLYQRNALSTTILMRMILCLAQKEFGAGLYKPLVITLINHAPIVDGVNTLDYQDIDGLSAMHFTALTSHSDVLDALIRAGANPCIRDCAGGTVLSHAVRFRRPANVGIILKALEVQARARDVGVDDPEVAHNALMKFVNIPDHYGIRSIHLCARHRDVETFKLLANYADFYLFDNKKEGFLFYVVNGIKLNPSRDAPEPESEAKAIEFLNFVFAHPAFLKTNLRELCDQRNRAGDTILSYCVKNNFNGVLQCLLANGANPNQKSREGMSLVQHAIKSFKPTALSILLGLGGNLEVTPLPFSETELIACCDANNVLRAFGNGLVSVVDVKRCQREQSRLLEKLLVRLTSQLPIGYLEDETSRKIRDDYLNFVDARGISALHNAVFHGTVLGVRAFQIDPKICLKDLPDDFVPARMLIEAGARITPPVLAGGCQALLHARASILEIPSLRSVVFEYERRILYLITHVTVDENADNEIPLHSVLNNCFLHQFLDGARALIKQMPVDYAATLEMRNKLKDYQAGLSLVDEAVGKEEEAGKEEAEGKLEAAVRKADTEPECITAERTALDALKAVLEGPEPVPAARRGPNKRRAPGRAGPNPDLMEKRAKKDSVPE